jgi:hypothetical protein
MPDTDTQTGLTPLPPVKSKSNPLPGEQITLTDAERASKFKELEDLYAEAAWPEAEVKLRKADWREYNCSDLPSARRWPIQTWDGAGHSSNIKFPLLRRYTDAWVAQVSESTFAERPLIAVAPEVGDEDPERAKRVEQRLDSVYETILKYPRVADKWARRTAIEGVGILHLPYRKREKFLLKRAEAGTGVQDGTFSTIYDAPKPEVVPLDRFRLYPNNAETIDDAWGVFYSYRLSLSDLEKGRKPGKDSDGNRTAPKYIISDEEWDVIKRGDADEEVVAEERTTETTNHTRINAVDVYCRYAYIKGETALPVVMTFLPDYKALIRATPSSTGDIRPFVAMRCRETGNGFIGLPMNRVIEQCATGINVLWNQSVNHTTLRHLLTISPFFNPGLGVDINKPWLGRPVACNDPNGIKFLDIGPGQDVLPQVQFLLDQLEASVGVNANALGVQLPNSRTATEINTMSTQGARIFREQIELMNCAHVEAAEIISWQYYLNGPSEVQYLAKPTKQEAMQNMPPVAPQSPQDAMGAEMDPMGGMGEMPPEMGMEQQAPQPPEYITRSIKAEDFAPGLTYAVRGSGAHMNRASEVQEALETRLAFIEDPLVMADAGRLWELDSKVLTAQRHPDPEGVLGAKPDAGTSVMQLMAQAAPPMPAPPEPVVEPEKAKVSTSFADLAPDAAAVYLEQELGLPGDMTAQGYRDQLQAMQKDFDVATRPVPVVPQNGSGGNNTTKEVQR